MNPTTTAEESYRSEWEFAAAVVAGYAVVIPTRTWLTEKMAMALRGNPNLMYLRSSRARRPYTCANCSSLISQGTFYFRDDNLFARLKHGAAARQYCASCILGKKRGEEGGPRHSPEGAYQLVLPFGEQVIIHPARVEVVDFTEELVRRLLRNYDEIYDLTPESFEDLIQNRICAMGHEARRVGDTFSRDGGLDILFWPVQPCPVPFLGAVQVKHHRAPSRKTGPGPVREMAGIMSSRPLQIGMVVTNTSFTADARWFADHQAPIVRLRDMNDLKRWIVSNFTDEAEWREMPVLLELAPGVIVDMSKKGGSGRDRA